MQINLSGTMWLLTLKVSREPPVRRVNWQFQLSLFKQDDYILNKAIKRDKKTALIYASQNWKESKKKRIMQHQRRLEDADNMVCLFCSED